MAHKTITDIEKLMHRLDTIVHPDSMSKVLGNIPGNAFFPGGSGVLTSEKNISEKPVMILGQDFDGEENYNKSLQNGEENIRSNATWRNLLSLLEEAKINPKDCFYTNATMGVRKGASGVGKSPAFKDKGFIKECQDFFLYQLELQRPRVILVLGKHTAEFLSPVAERLSDWGKIISFTELDKAGLQVKGNILFNNGITTSIALLTHPSYRPVNVKRRRFEGLQGCEAEIKMIQSIL